MVEGAPTFETSGTGATVQPQYMGRTMKCYPVQEAEMEMLSTLNSQATGFFSIGSALAAYAASIWTNAAFASALTESGKTAAQQVAPVTVFLAIAFALLGWDAVRRRGSLWSRIRSEAQAIPTTTVITTVETVVS